MRGLIFSKCTEDLNVNVEATIDSLMHFSLLCSEGNVKLFCIALFSIPNFRVVFISDVEFYYVLCVLNRIGMSAFTSPEVGV